MGKVSGSKCFLSTLQKSHLSVFLEPRDLLFVCFIVNRGIKDVHLLAIVMHVHAVLLFM